MPRTKPRPVAPPVRGSWIALNSPGDRVPSHGTHAFGQTYAIDLVASPGPEGPRRSRAGAFRPPEDFPSFGREALAPAAGRGVTVRDGARDHRSRSTQFARELMKVEGLVRSLAGTRFLAGNHIVLDLGDDVYASLVHLKRNSARVTAGEQVRQGQALGQCGNSGNSSEPHLHFQLMDHPRQLIAAGLPFSFTGPTEEAAVVSGQLPGNGEVIVAPVGPP